MTTNPDRLYDLVPVVYRLRDADRGYPLRALLQVISEQVNLVEQDIEHLYDNWFIETCDDWVVPYIGGLIGYQPVALTGSATGTSQRAQTRERISIPRREVGNTIRFRRRKGTLAILEQLATAVAQWPSHAVEFYRSLAVSQNVNFLHLDRGRTAELRDGDALLRIGGPFDEMAHSVDVRRVSSTHSTGRANIPEVGVFVWRLQAYSVTRSAPYHYREQAANCYLFNALGHDTQLYTNPEAGTGLPYPDLKLPLPITRRGLEFRTTNEASGQVSSGVPFYFGSGKSFAIWTGTPPVLLDADKIVAADLTDWSYRPRPGYIAVDPMLGRLVVPPGLRRPNLMVSYMYAFSGNMGGGEYARPIKQPANAKVYYVGGATGVFRRIGDAIMQWKTDQPKDAVIEITNSSVYSESLSIQLSKGQTLQLRASVGARPVVWLSDRPNTNGNGMTVSGDEQTYFVVDGLVVAGQGIQIEGGLSGVTIRHCTLVPGRGLQCNCNPTDPTEPSISLNDAPLCLAIEHSIVGAIQVERNEVTEDPVQIHISDSIVDATSSKHVALGAPEKMCAYSSLSLMRSTVFGELQSRTIELAENSILMGSVKVCRRQQGCMRFCYVSPGSRTPRRYECQPDLVERAVSSLVASNKLPASLFSAVIERERLRVEPEFNSTRYGNPTYCQLANTCALEVKTGAEDKSEMGVFHDLYQPQRASSLAARINEYTPAETDAAIIVAS